MAGSRTHTRFLYVPSAAPLLHRYQSMVDRLSELGLLLMEEGLRYRGLCGGIDR